jgi:hypothetical protein
VLSGGMDGALWLWPAAGAAGTQAPDGHAGPVSQARARRRECSRAAGPWAGAGARKMGAGQPSRRRPPPPTPLAVVPSRAQVRALWPAGDGGAGGGGGLALSGSYDKTLALWDASGPRAPRRLARFAGPGAAVLEVEASPGPAGVWAAAGELGRGRSGAGSCV